MYVDNKTSFLVYNVNSIETLDAELEIFMRDRIIDDISTFFS